MLGQLLRPWSYLRIKADGKWWFDWAIPGVLSALFLAVVVVAGMDLNVYGDSGLVAKMTGFVQSLPGFFIAALAAVATFNRNDLDELIPEPSPTLVVFQRGHSRESRLTRRRFLCALFSFLTGQSIALTCLGILLISFAPWLKGAFSIEVLAYIRNSGVFVYILCLFQLISVTCMGLYYLGDRLHLPDQ